MTRIAGENRPSRGGSWLEAERSYGRLRWRRRARSVLLGLFLVFALVYAVALIVAAIYLDDGAR